MINQKVEKGKLKVICPKCNKIVDGKVEYDFSYQNTTDSETLDADIKITIKCAECGTEIYAQKDTSYIILGMI